MVWSQTKQVHSVRTHCGVYPRMGAASRTPARVHRHERTRTRMQAPTTTCASKQTNAPASVRLEYDHHDLYRRTPFLRARHFERSHAIICKRARTRTRIPRALSHARATDTTFRHWTCETVTSHSSIGASPVGGTDTCSAASDRERCGLRQCGHDDDSTRALSIARLQEPNDLEPQRIPPFCKRASCRRARFG